jgi:serine/threonine protein kinase
LRVTDFGISREFNPENSKDTSGTPGYMAPEVMCRNNHSYESDYYALGRNIQNPINFIILKKYFRNPKIKIIFV